MCGIVGFIATEPGRYKEKSDWMKAALIADTIRGHHSTGIFNVPFKHEDYLADWCKAVEPGPEFVQNDLFIKRNRQADGQRYFVGHNRFATMGSIDVASAHPFQEGDITLVHNGTLHSMSILPFDYGEAEVDSHAITHNIAEAGVEDVKEVLEHLYGAFTLVWHDARDNSLNIARNSKRPLAMAQSGHDGTVYFCSEDGMLRWLGGRIGLKLNSVYSPKVGVHLKWLPDNIVPEIEPFEVMTYSSNAYYNYYNRGGHAWNYYDRSEEYAASAASKSVPPSNSANDLSVEARAAIRVAGFDPYQTYPFYPYEKKKLSGRKLRVGDSAYYTTALVNGLIYDTSAVILGGHSLATYEGHWPKKDPDDCWSVKVVDVRHSPEGPVMVCKVESFVYHPPEEDDPLGDDIPWSTTLVGPCGAYLEREEWRKLTEDGCCMCGDPIYEMDHDETEWTSGTDTPKPICYNCVESWDGVVEEVSKKEASKDAS